MHFNLKVISFTHICWCMADDGNAIYDSNFNNITMLKNLPFNFEEIIVRT